MEDAAMDLPLPFLIDVASSISQPPHGGSGVVFSCIFIGILELLFQNLEALIRRIFFFVVVFLQGFNF
jgi:hypothetical protein